MYAPRPSGTALARSSLAARCGGTINAPEKGAPVKNFDPEIITIAPAATHSRSRSARVRI